MKRNNYTSCPNLWLQSYPRPSLEPKFSKKPTNVSLIRLCSECTTKISWGHPSKGGRGSPRVEAGSDSCDSDAGSVPGSQMLRLDTSKPRRPLMPVLS